MEKRRKGENRYVVLAYHLDGADVLQPRQRNVREIGGALNHDAACSAQSGQLHTSQRSIAL
jgi:hypothetical protein